MTSGGVAVTVVITMIIDYLLNWGKEKGYSEFQLDVYTPNISAIKAYEKAGFTPETLTMRINTRD